MYNGEGETEEKMEIIETFIVLLWGHAVADFGLQSHQMATYKNRNNKPDLPPGQKRVAVWPYYLTAHAMIHGAMVYLITGSVIWGIYETMVHWGLDYIKTTNHTNPHQDQLGHIFFKLMIAYWVTT